MCLSNDNVPKEKETNIFQSDVNEWSLTLFVDSIESPFQFKPDNVFGKKEPEFRDMLRVRINDGRIFVGKIDGIFDDGAIYCDDVWELKRKS